MKILIKNARELKGLKTRELAQLLEIDASLVSKFESGSRVPTEIQLKKIAHILDISFKELKILWIKEKILKNVYEQSYGIEAFIVAEQEVKYYSKSKENSTHEYSDFNDELNYLNTLKEDINEKRKTEHYKLIEALELEYTFESNRIEGNTLTLQETDLVLNKGITISGKSLQEHLEAVNHKEAVEFIKEILQQKIPITEKLILELHYLILKGINSEYAGKYRNVQVMIQGSSFLPPAPYLVAKQMEDLMLWYLENKLVLHPIILAAEMHQRLVTIHPFIDGNGRTSRLLMNLILLQNGFVIANIKGDYDSRINYYKSLENSQLMQSNKDFVSFIFEVEKACLERLHSML